MPVIVSEGTSFKPAPEGQWRAVCVDVVEMPQMQTAFGLKDKLRLVWQIEETDPENEGKPYIVVAFFTASIHEKAALRKFLEAWRAKKFTPEELAGFDVEKLIGVNAYLQVQHSEPVNGKVYANVSSIMPLPKGMHKVAATADYVRVKDRPKDGAQPESGATTIGPDDDLPF